MRLLAGTEIHQAVNDLVSREGDVDIAVAYWGQDSLDRTGIANKENGKLRVICDLLSGSCNPAPVAALKKDGKPVLTLDRLHAKVWINGNDVILGSANASMAGLPMPTDDPDRCRQEANVEIRDEALAQSLRNWFEERWDSAREIEDRDLRRAWIRWNQRRRSARSKDSGIANEPDESRISDLWRNPSDLRLLAYDEDKISPAAQRFRSEEARGLYTDREWAAVGDEPPFYEWEGEAPEWARHSGTAILDFSRSEPDAPFRCNGLWTVRSDAPIDLGASTLTLLNRASDFNGKYFSSQERRQIAEKIRTRVDEQGGEPDKFGSLLDLNFFGLWEDDRPAIRRRLISDARNTAIDLCRSGGFRLDIIADTIRICVEDPDWAFDYAKYVGADIFADENDRKNEINPIMARKIREAIDGRVARTASGARRTVELQNEIIKHYSVVDRFDPTVVGTDDNDE